MHPRLNARTRLGMKPLMLCGRPVSPWDLLFAYLAVLLGLAIVGAGYWGVVFPVEAALSVR